VWAQRLSWRNAFAQVGRVWLPTVSPGWHACPVTEIDAKIDALVPAWLTLPDIAEQLGVEVTRVRQLVKEGQLIAVRRGENRALHVPAAFIDGNEQKVVKGLSGTLTLLRDDGFTDEEMLEWLFTPDESLPGTPAQALSENRGTEVKRRAQALAV
jgi:hypothetical protein